MHIISLLKANQLTIEYNNFNLTTFKCQTILIDWPLEQFSTLIRTFGCSCWTPKCNIVNISIYIEREIGSSYALAFPTRSLRFILFNFFPFFFVIWIHFTILLMRLLLRFVCKFYCFSLFCALFHLVCCFCFYCGFAILLCDRLYMSRLFPHFYCGVSFSLLFFFSFDFRSFSFFLILYWTNLGVMGVMPDNGIIVGDYLVASTSPTSD